MNTNPCPFCRPKNILAETNLSFVLPSNPRLTFGHLLIVPKRHIERPWELQDDEAADIWNLIKKYQQLLAKKIGEGCDIRQNYRPFLAQNRLKVDHIHWHLIPRTNQDDIYRKTQINEQDIFKDLSSAELNKVKFMLS